MNRETPGTDPMDGACGAKTRSGSPCRRRPMAGKRRCRMHGGRSTGPRTPRGKRRASANALKHGLYAAYLSPAELDNLAQLRNPDLSGEVALLRALVRRALEWAPGNLRAWAQLAELVGGLVGRVGRLVETRARLKQGSASDAGLQAQYNLNLVFDSFSREELEAVIVALEDDRLRPLHRLLIPLLESGQLGKALRKADDMEVGEVRR